MDPKQPRATPAPVAGLDVTATDEDRAEARSRPREGHAAVELASATTDAAGDAGSRSVSGSHPNRTRYGRYELISELGAGGMGVVYEAYDPDLDRCVALKVIGQSQRKLGAVARDRLVREARALAKLSHPNVIAIHDVGSVGEEAFVAMELVKGRTLKDWLRTACPGRDKLLDVFAQAGRGLAAAHAAGLVHRDFKPANVMVEEDGRVRVLDFGLARLADPDSAGDRAVPVASDSAPLGTLTHTGGILGTPAYMAPEQLVGGPVDERTDQFSFCVALYEALYGRRPFSGDSFAARAETIAAGVDDETSTDRSVPERLRRAVMLGLQAAPGDRHPSMTALLDELGRAPREVRRRGGGRVAVALGLVAAVAVAAFVASSPMSGGAGPHGAVGATSNVRRGLRMQMGDSGSGLMAKLVEYAEGDPEAKRLGIAPEALSWRVPATGESVTERYLVSPDRGVLEAYLAELSRRRSDLAPEPGHEILLESRDGVWRTHYVWTRIELDASSIVNATVHHDDDTGEPEVVVRFNEQGTAHLAATTGQNVGRRLATVVNGTVTAAAVISGPIGGGVVAIKVDGEDQPARERAASELARDLSPRR